MKQEDVRKKAAANLKKTFELIEVTKKLNIGEDARKNPGLSNEELNRRFCRRRVCMKDRESRKFSGLSPQVPLQSLV